MSDQTNDDPPTAPQRKPAPTGSIFREAIARGEIIPPATRRAGADA